MYTCTIQFWPGSLQSERLLPMRRVVMAWCTIQYAMQSTYPFVRLNAKTEFVFDPFLLINPNHQYETTSNNNSKATKPSIHHNAESIQALKRKQAILETLLLIIKKSWGKKNIQHSKQHSVGQWLGRSVFRRAEELSTTNSVLIIREPCQWWNHRFLYRRQTWAKINANVGNSAIASSMEEEAETLQLSSPRSRLGSWYSHGFEHRTAHLIRSRVDYAQLGDSRRDCSNLSSPQQKCNCMAEDLDWEVFMETTLQEQAERESTTSPFTPASCCPPTTTRPRHGKIIFFVEDDTLYVNVLN